MPEIDWTELNTVLVKSTRIRKEWIIFAALALLVLALRYPSLEQPFDNDGSVSAYHARLIVRGEPLYGSHHPDHHLPGTYYTYALAFILFGDSVWAVKFLLILWTILVVYLIYRLGVLLMHRAMGIVAGVFYSVLTSHIWMWGTSAPNELFANLPRVAAVLLLLYFVERKVAPWKFIFVGLLAAASFLYKANYLSPLLLTGIVLLGELWPNRTQPDAWRTTVLKGLWLAAGVVVGIVPVVIYFYAIGLLPRLLLVFSLGLGYVNREASQVSPQDRLFFPFLGLGLNNPVLLVFSLAGLVQVFVEKIRDTRSGRQNESTNLLAYIAIWYILTLLEASVSRVPFLHYYLLVVPPLALLASWFLFTLYHKIKKSQQKNYPLAAAIILGFLLFTVLFFSARQNFNYYYHFTRYKMGLESHQDFLLKGWPVAGEELVRVQALADYIRAHTTPDDFIYYHSIYTQVYYLSDRRSPIDTLFPRYAEATGSYSRIFVPQTKYIIVDNNADGPAWLYTELAKNYVLETIIENQSIYRRNTSTIENN